MEDLFFSLQWVLNISIRTEFPTKMPFLVVLLSRVKKIQLGLGDCLLSKEIPVLVMCGQRMLYNTHSSILGVLREHEHLLSTPYRKLQQEGCWHHLAKASWSPVGFFFLLGPKTGTSSPGQNKISGLPPLFVPATLQV